MIVSSNIPRVELLARLFPSSIAGFFHVIPGMTVSSNIPGWNIAGYYWSQIPSSIAGFFRVIPGMIVSSNIPRVELLARLFPSSIAGFFHVIPGMTVSSNIPGWNIAGYYWSQIPSSIAGFFRVIPGMTVSLNILGWNCWDDCSV